MNKINIELLQEQLNKVCDELVEIKEKERAISSEKDADWAPLAAKIAVHREQFNEARDLIQSYERQKKAKISSIYDTVNTLRHKMTEDALEAKKNGDMEKVQELTLIASELSLRLQPGIILQNDIEVTIEDLDKVPKSFIKNNEKIQEILRTELRKYVRRNPHEDVPGIKKHETISVKVREGQQKKL